MAHTIFITGTDTGVGKTVIAALLTGFLLQRGSRIAALKPICSGDREDGRILRAAADNCLSLDEVNPWHFKMPLAPLLAAKMERESVRLPAVLGHVRAVQRRFEVTLIEGAGGLLSPLGGAPGRTFNSRDLIKNLAAMPILVAPNRLGTVNAILLSLEALPSPRRKQAQICLIGTPHPQLAQASNPALLKRLVTQNVHCFPWFGADFSLAGVLKNSAVRKALKTMAEATLGR
jgi:dethiobiotin synthetase